MSKLSEIFNDNSDLTVGLTPLMTEEKFIEVVTAMFNGNPYSTFLPGCRRVEVIDQNGRSYVNMNCNTVEKQMQDDNRTLKIFIK